MFQVGCGTLNYPVILRILGVVAMVLNSMCTKHQVNILNDCEVTADEVFPL